MPRIILASQSPRRRQLLAQIGVTDFDILVPDADESYDPALSPQDIVCSICRKKAEAARLLADDPDAVLIAADTMVFLDGLRLGKPRSQEEAFAMLSPPYPAGPTTYAPASPCARADGWRPGRRPRT